MPQLAKYPTLIFGLFAGILVSEASADDLEGVVIKVRTVDSVLHRTES